MPSSPPQRVVVDASALLERLLRSRRGEAVAQAVGGARMVAPDHVNVELLSALRGLVRSRQLAAARASQAVDDLLAAPLNRVGTTELVAEIWRWRDNLSPYDAGYVALANALACPLVTADGRLRRAVADAVAVVLV